MADECFIGISDRLQMQDAAAAIMVLEDGRYVMQLRDALPEIFYPGHWGCFGGAVADGETARDAFHRELFEELEYVPETCDEFTRFDFDLSKLGQPKVYRIYYEVRVSDAAFGKFVLHEGAAFEAINGRELLTERKVTPYDAWALWAHMNKRRFRT